MGDRAVVVVVDGEQIAPAALYLHWCDGATGIGAVIGKALKLMADRPGDAQYFLARLAGIACAEHQGNTGVGIIEAPENLPPPEDYSHGDAGVIVVNVAEGMYGQIGAYHGYVAGSRPDCGTVRLLLAIGNHFPGASLAGVPR